MFESDSTKLGGWVSPTVGLIVELNISPIRLQAIYIEELAYSKVCPLLLCTSARLIMDWALIQ